MSCGETPYLCRHCKNPLGVASDKSLVVGVVRIVQPVRLECGHCGQKTTWRPELTKIRVPDSGLSCIIQPMNDEHWKDAWSEAPEELRAEIEKQLSPGIEAARTVVVESEVTEV